MIPRNLDQTGLAARELVETLGKKEAVQLQS
jgi:hypothetical protein